MNNNNYWTNKGRFQNEYEQLKAVDFNFNQEEQNAFHKYYRYYNDGDMPVGSKYYSKASIETYLEIQASIAIAKAYARATKGNCSAVIKMFSQRKLKGFKAWME